VEVDVETIKRSMNASSEVPQRNNLAVDLSVAEALRTRRPSTDASKWALLDLS
jgi:hypothetical protein